MKLHIMMTTLLLYANLSLANGNHILKMDSKCVSSGYYEYLHECGAYISCRNAEAELKYCPVDRIFHNVLQICDTTESVDCNARTSSIEDTANKLIDTPTTINEQDNPCAGQNAGISFPLRTDCHQYILCLGNDQSVVANCPVSAWYDPKTGSCGPDVSPTACLESEITSTTTIASPHPNELCFDQELGISYPLVTDCKKYIVCLGNGESAVANCIYNAWYDPNTGNCGPNVSPTACWETTTTTVGTTTKESTLETTSSTNNVKSSTTQATTTTTALPISPDVCGDLINGEYVAYPDNCSKYIVCVEPIPIAFYCTPGYYFNEQLQVCVDWAESDCPALETTVLPPANTTPGYTAPTMCENNNGGNISYPENCRWFIRCINDHVYMMGVCNNGEYYDISMGKCSASATDDACLPRTSTMATTRATSMATTASTPTLRTTATIPSTTSTTTATTPRPSSTTLSTTSTTATTSRPSSTTTTTPSTTTTTPAPAADPCAGVAVGKLVPYPNDCTKFIKCEHPTHVIYDCARGQEFSAQLERCMAPWIANCTVEGGTKAAWIFKAMQHL